MPQGTAGVIILWKDDLAQYVEPLPDGSDRIAAAKIHTSEGDVIVVNTYMPADGTHTDADYSSLLYEMYEIVKSTHHMQKSYG